MALVAENIHDKFQLEPAAPSRRLQDHAQVAASSTPLIESEQRKIQALEEFVRMPRAGLLPRLPAS